MCFLDESFVRDSARWIGMDATLVDALASAARQVRHKIHLLQAAEHARDLIFQRHEDRPAVLRALPTFEGDGEAGRLLYVLVYLSGLPLVRRLNAARGIDQTVTRRTLMDLDLWIRAYRLRYGVFGFSEIDWPVWHFTGRLFTLGRLQFQVMNSPWDLPGLHKGDPVLGVHIPATGPLLDAACEESFRLAAEFFPRHFPDHPFVAFTCESWMMDPHLALYLPPDSNLIRFQRRFSLFPPPESLAWQLYQRVLGWEVRTVQDAPPPRTTLQRAVLEHVRRGGHWQGGLGIRLVQPMQKSSHPAGQDRSDRSPATGVGSAGKTGGD